MSLPEIYFFDDFTLDVGRKELRRHIAGSAEDQLLPIREQAFELLVYLIRNQDQAVRKADAWKNIPMTEAKRREGFDVNVVDQALTVLRHRLGDDRETFISSARRGHLRFICPLKARPEAPEGEHPKDQPPPVLRLPESAPVPGSTDDRDEPSSMSAAAGVGNSEGNGALGDRTAPVGVSLAEPLVEEPATPSSAVGGSARRNAAPRKILAVALLLLAALAISVLGIWRRSGRGAPSRIDVQADTLIVRDGQGREIWKKLFREGLSDAAYRNSGRLKTQYYLGDVNNDGRRELLFVRAVADPTQPQDLICYSGEGTELWRYRPYNPALKDKNTGAVYTCNGPRYSGRSGQVLTRLFWHGLSPLA